MKRKRKRPDIFWWRIPAWAIVFLFNPMDLFCMLELALIYLSEEKDEVFADLVLKKIKRVLALRPSALVSSVSIGANKDENLPYKLSVRMLFDSITLELVADHRLSVHSSEEIYSLNFFYKGQKVLTAREVSPRIFFDLYYFHNYEERDATIQPS